MPAKCLMLECTPKSLIVIASYRIPTAFTTSFILRNAYSHSGVNLHPSILFEVSGKCILNKTILDLYIETNSLISATVSQFQLYRVVNIATLCPFFIAYLNMATQSGLTQGSAYPLKSIRYSDGVLSIICLKVSRLIYFISFP